jgi:endonuclease YncB( thermonuclease family)
VGVKPAEGAIATLAVLALGVAGCGEPESTTAPAAVASPASESATVAYVNDGDTLRTTSGHRVRLLQIDAPELHGDCFGKAALVALRQLAPKGSHITLVRDPALDATDRYGRQLRYVFVPGTNVNIALVRGGAAAPYFFGKGRGRYARDLIDAVEEARAAHRGYWGACPGAKLNTALGSITGPA